MALTGSAEADQSEAGGKDAHTREPGDKPDARPRDDGLRTLVLPVPSGRPLHEVEGCLDRLVERELLSIEQESRST